MAENITAWEKIFVEVHCAIRVASPEDAKALKEFNRQLKRVKGICEKLKSNAPAKD